MPKRAVNIALIDSPIAIEIFDDIVKNEYIVPSTFAGLTFAQTIRIGITTKMLQIRLPLRHQLKTKNLICPTSNSLVTQE